MNAALLIVILVLIIALVGISMLNEKRKQHAAQRPDGSAFQRRIDSNSPGIFYSQHHKNPWVVDPPHAQPSSAKPQVKEE